MTGGLDLTGRIVADVDAVLTAHATTCRAHAFDEPAWLDALDAAADALFIRAIGFRLLGLPDDDRATAFDKALERLVTTMTQRRAGILATVRLQECCYGPA